MSNKRDDGFSFFWWLLLIFLLFGTGAKAQPIVEVYNADQLHAAIADASVHSSGTAAPVTVYIRGTIRGHGFEFLPNIVVECPGSSPSKPHFEFDADADGPMWTYPDRIKSGGGGANFPYQHHTELNNCTLDGKGKPFDLVQIYNGGFRMQLDGNSFKNTGGNCVKIERTALNTYLTNNDFSNCGKAVYADLYDSWSGILKIENGQIDNSGDGDAPIVLRFAKQGGLQGSMMLVHLEALQFEWQQHQMDKNGFANPRAVVHTISESQVARPVVYYESFSATTWLGNGYDYQLEAFALETGDGRAGVHTFVNILHRIDQIPLTFKSNEVSWLGTID